MKEKLSKLKNVYKKYGFWGFIKKCFSYLRANYLDRVSFEVIFHKKKYHQTINGILEKCDYDRVIIWRSSFGFNVPLFQRPQHIANNLAKQKCLVFYEVTRMSDKLKTIKKQNDNLYLINFTNKSLINILYKELNLIDKPKYLDVFSANFDLSLKEVHNYEKRGFKVIYEYIDEIDADISGTRNIPKNVIDKYNYAMENKDVYVIVSAKTLEEDTIKHRGKENMTFSSNGVDYAFFENFSDDYKLDDDFNKILKLGKPIVCYYGALAKWFDYNLVKKIAKTNKYSIVLFGVKYDEEFDKHFSNYHNNIYFLGSRDYKVLKYYANKCDILTIPFLINDITQSTSPVKIFEYMALHKPIVVTDLAECRQYKSVMIGHNHEEFIKLLDKAMTMKKDKKYIELLDKEARANDWYNKAEAIIDLIKKDEK